MSPNWLNRSLIVCTLLFCVVSRSAFATGLDFDRNMHLGSWSRFAAYWEGSTPVCVWTESEEVAFRIIAYNHNNIGAFALGSSLGEGVPFSLFWQDYDNLQMGEKLKAGTPSSQAYYYKAGKGCGISPNYLMRVRVNRADFDNVMPGIYKGSLILMLSPI